MAMEALSATVLVDAPFLALNELAVPRMSLTMSPRLHGSLAPGQSWKLSMAKETTTYLYVCSRKFSKSLAAMQSLPRNGTGNATDRLQKGGQAFGAAQLETEG